MRQVGRPGGLALAVLLALVFGGCGPGAPPASSSTEEAKVKGKVTLKGYALGKVEVRFNAANINRKSAPAAMAVTNDDGSYEITTFVGENTITLGGAALSKRSKELAYFNKSFDVQSGDNTFDIAIP
jgi:hypothetical protein